MEIATSTEIKDFKAVPIPTDSAIVPEKVSVDIHEGARQKYGEWQHKIKNCSFYPGALSFALIKFDDEGYQIGDENRKSLTHYPLEIEDIFKKLSVYVCQVLQFPESDIEIIECTGVTFSGSGGSRRVEFKFAKMLDLGYPWNTTTNKLAENPVDGGHPSKVCSEQAALVLENLRVRLIQCMEEYAKEVKVFSNDNPDIPLDLASEAAQSVMINGSRTDRKKLANGDIFEDVDSEEE